MNQWNLTVRQALFASFYHTWIRHTEVLTRFTSPIDPRYVNPRACTACVYSSISLHFKFDPDREPDHVCLCNVVPTSAILRFNSWTVLRHPCLFFLRFATFSQRNVSGTRRVLKNQGGWSTIMVVVLPVAQRQGVISTCTAAPPVLPLDENQAKQLVLSSTLTKFSLAKYSEGN